MAQIHLNKTGIATVVLDGEAKNAHFTSDDVSVCTAGLSSSAQGSVFTGLVAPVAIGDTFVRFQCTKMDDSGTLQQAVPVSIIQGPATAIVSFNIVEN